MSPSWSFAGGTKGKLIMKQPANTIRGKLICARCSGCLMCEAGHFEYFRTTWQLTCQHEAGIFISFHTPERKPCDMYAAQNFILRGDKKQPSLADCTISNLVVFQHWTWATPMYGKPLETLRVLRSNILSPFGLRLPHLVDQALEHRRFPPPGKNQNIKKRMVWVGKSGQCWIKASCIFCLACWL